MKSTNKTYTAISLLSYPIEKAPSLSLLWIELLFMQTLMTATHEDRGYK